MGATEGYALRKEPRLRATKPRELGVPVKTERYRSVNICPINHLLLYCKCFFNITDWLLFIHIHWHFASLINAMADCRTGIWTLTRKKRGKQ